MSLKVNRTIISNEELRNGFYVSFKEREKDYKLLIKRVEAGEIIGGTIYFESVPKHEKFVTLYRFVIRTIEENIRYVENMYFWEFGEPVFKSILQRRC